MSEGVADSAAPGARADGRDVGLDAIRVAGIAAVIALLHAIGYISRAVGRSIDFGDGIQTVITALALGMVTIVSGYVIARAYPELRDRRAIWRFARRRLVRLYPLYAVALLVFWLAWFRDMTPVWVLAQFACVGVLVSGLGFPLVATIYYVQITFVCYALYALVMSTTGKTRTLLVTLLGVTLIVWCAVLGIGDSRVLLYVPLFGMGAYWGLAGKGMVTSGRWLAAAGIVAVGSSVSLLLYADRAPDWVVHVLMSILPVAAFLPAWWMGARAGAVAPRAVRALAYGSLAAFLFHRPVLSAIDNLVSVPGYVLNAVLFSVVGTIASFGIGWAAQRSYDSFILRLRRSA